MYNSCDQLSWFRFRLFLCICLGLVFCVFLGCIIVLHACCYRPSTVVCRSVGRSVTVVSPAKTAKPIEMLFVSRTLVSPRNDVLDEVQIPL